MVHGRFSKDLYLLLRLPRTATKNEIKEAYREVALRLHPDRHDGCSAKTAAFQEVTEAYRVLSDGRAKREYDQWLRGVEVGADGTVRNVSRAAQRNPFYRKVYSPAAPPGMKTFDRQRHYDMHYGDGMMKEEIERARRRAEAASPRNNGASYQSPLGRGFSFDREKPMDQQRNPYSRKGIRQHDHLHNGGIQVEYEEGYVDMGGEDMDKARRMMRGKERVVERMNERRKYRARERGDAPGSRRPRRSDDSEGCTIM